MNIHTVLFALASLNAAIAAYILFLTITNAIWLMWTNLVSPVDKGELVSVLVPARNEAERISDCLDSLLRQNYSPYEIIVYDDDSSDGTAAILDAYAKKYPGLLQVIDRKSVV